MICNMSLEFKELPKRKKIHKVFKEQRQRTVASGRVRSFYAKRKNEERERRRENRKMIDLKNWITIQENNFIMYFLLLRKYPKTALPQELFRSEWVGKRSFYPSMTLFHRETKSFITNNLFSFWVYYITCLVKACCKIRKKVIFSLPPPFPKHV